MRRSRCLTRGPLAHRDGSVADEIAAGAPRPARTRRRALASGFTLTELLVVIGIIGVLAVSAVPAIYAFRQGQLLEHSGRIMTSTFNDARRLAVTKHARHCVVLYEYEEIAGDITSTRDAIRIYQGPTGVKPGPGVPADVSKGYWEGGYVGEPIVLPQNVRFQPSLMESHRLAGLPDEKSSPLFQPHTQKGQKSNDIIAFRADGTIEDRVDASPMDTARAANIFLPDEGYYAIPDTQRADLVIIQVAGAGLEVKQGGKAKRCLVDLNLGTGRATARVFEIGQGYGYLTPGQQTPGG
jgi:prepilin-type N-terminal cleavage/methylation domain-containing protein